MIEVLNYLEIDYVVLGNHEFDFGGEYLQTLLARAQFTCLGSNIRQSSDLEIFPGLVDSLVLPLANGLKLGMFGVCTTATGKDEHAGPQVSFEDEATHARRCIADLQAQGANAIVALTHLKITNDRKLVKAAPGIHLVLGGHDHEPMSCFQGHTYIHKSGADALWLGVVHMTITPSSKSGHEPSALLVHADVDFEWRMICNFGMTPDPGCRALLLQYAEQVRRDDEAQGKLVALAKTLTLIDGTRATLRTREANAGNLVADAMRSELQTDVVIINAGLIKGDKWYDAGMTITPRWVEQIIPHPKTSVVVEMSVKDLREALAFLMRRHPEMTSSFPQVSGIRICFDHTDANAPGRITSLRLAPTDDDQDQQIELSMDTKLTVAIPVWSHKDERAFFDRGRQIRIGPIIRDMVASFVTRKQEISYPRSEQRIVIRE